jgi:hypothetical protein
VGLNVISSRNRGCCCGSSPPSRVHEVRPNSSPWSEGIQSDTACESSQRRQLGALPLIAARNVSGVKRPRSGEIFEAGIDSGFPLLLMFRRMALSPITCASAVSVTSRRKLERFRRPIPETGAKAVDGCVFDLHSAPHHFHCMFDKGLFRFWPTNEFARDMVLRTSLDGRQAAASWRF